MQDCVQILVFFGGHDMAILCLAMGTEKTLLVGEKARVEGAELLVALMTDLEEGVDRLVRGNGWIEEEGL